MLCHLAGNLKNKLSPKVAKEAISIWKKIKIADNYEEGDFLYDSLLFIVKKYKPEYAEYLSKLKENYLNFLKYPEDIRKYIYTTLILWNLLMHDWKE